MTRQEFIKYTEGMYNATHGLIKLSPDNKLNYKPMEGVLTLAQVIKHCATTLGCEAQRAIQNSWPEMSPGDALPAADKYPVSASVKEALDEIEKDWQLMKDELGKISEEEFNTKMVNVPWLPFPVTIADYMMLMMEHLCNHRYQLFIWLKLSGEKVNTVHLYGMA